MLDTIKYCYENKLVTYFYFDSQELCGYIAYYNDDEVVINHISTNGLYDGYIVRHISDIAVIDYDCKYCKQIEKLYKIRNQTHKAIDFNADEIIYTMLDFAKENNYIISLDVKDMDFSGIVVDYKDNIITINEVDKNGEKDGINVIDLDNVNSLFVDTEDEQKLRLLLNN